MRLTVAARVGVGNACQLTRSSRGRSDCRHFHVPANIHAPIHVIVADLDRLAHWIGREEPKRAELWNAVDDIKQSVERGRDPRRALLKCAVAVNGLWSTALKRLLAARVRQLYKIAEHPEAHHAA